MWLEAGREGGDAKGDTGDVEQMVSAIFSLRREEFGTLNLVDRFSGVAGALGHGRPPLIGKGLFRAIRILMVDYGMNMSEISARTGISRATIYRAHRRYGIEFSDDEPSKRLRFRSTE